MKINLSNSELTASINSFGAELISLKNNSNREYIWEGNPDYWGKHSPILFPIVGSLKNNSYNYNNSIYHLPRHGFAREMDFDIIEQSNEKVVFSLKETAATLEKYPFKFELQIKLKNGDLTAIKTELQYLSKKEKFSPYLPVIYLEVAKLALKIHDNENAKKWLVQSIKNNSKYC